MARHAQITKNNKSAISLQYLKNEVSDKVDFCMQIRMQVSYKLRLGIVKHSQSSQNSNFAMFLRYLKKS